MKRVVVTGIGAVTPLGNSAGEFWKNAVLGTSGAAPITRFNAEKFKTRFACEVKNFDPLNWLDKAEVRKNDLFAQFALASVAEALEHAKVDLEKINKYRVGVIWGSGNGGMQTFEDQVTEFALGDGTPRFNPYFIPKMIVNIASGVISIKYGLKGMNYTTISACATGNTALMDAFNYIRWGKIDVVVSGGSEAPVTSASIGGFGAMKALSTNNENAASASRPFDLSRDGFVMGEGAGAIILESLEHAVERGAPILAELAGAAMTADAYHLSATHPEGEGAARAIQLALEDAGLQATDIQYINTHSTSTQLGDLSEIKAVQSVFGQSPGHLSISGTKSMTGHLLGAAGAIEAIICIESIRHGEIPPTINTTALDPQIPPSFDIVLGKSKKKEIKAAMSNAFGFGGHNSTVIFKEFVA